MGVVSRESLQKLTSEITKDLLADQEALQNNVKKLIIILRPQPSLIEEEKEANFRQSNSKTSQMRREDLYRSQMISIIREKKALQDIFINFLIQQREYLGTRERQEQAKQEKEKKSFEEMFSVLREADKKRLMELISHIEKLSFEINKIISMLEKVIGELKRTFIADNLHFIANHETILHRGIEAIGERAGGEFFLSINGVKTKINRDELIQMFTTINEEAFHQIAEGKEVQVSELRDKAEFTLTTYLSKIADTENVQPTVNQLMSVWDGQAELLEKHIILQTERQQETQDCINIVESFQKMREHIDDVKAKAIESNEPDLLTDLLNKGEECVQECATIVQAVNIDLISRASSTLTALERTIINEQEVLTKKEIQENEHTKQPGGKIP